MNTAHFSSRLGFALVLAVAAAASADPIADGRIDAGEYSDWNNVQYNLGGGGPTYGGGRFALRQSGGSVFMALVLDRDLVDNSYGELGSIGWGADAPSGKQHTFQSLLGSDDATFTFRDASGNAVSRFRIDYIADVAGFASGYGPELLDPKDAAGAKVPSAKDAAKKLKQAQDEYAKATKSAAKKAAEAAAKPDDKKKQKAAQKAADKLAKAKAKLDQARALYDAAAGSSTAGGAAPNTGVLSFGSSLSWNFATYGALLDNSPLPPKVDGKNVYGSPAGAPDWIWEVIYEVELDASLFLGGIGNPSIDLVHASPNKLGDNKVYIEIPPRELTPNPEPGTIVLFGVALAAAAAYRRRRR
jgi:hypothetical protein